jgi:hypothetical protein
MQSWKTYSKLVFAVTWLFASALMTPAFGSSFSTDNSDLWGNPAESGWGMQLVQRASVIFATIFVYDSKGVPVWYSAVLEASGKLTWTGDLMSTNGPWLGTKPFDPAAVTIAKVGTMTFAATSDKSGTLTYSVNGVRVNKQISRQTLRYDDYTGDYIGMLAYAAEGCPDFVDRGLSNNRVDFSIRQDGTTLTLAWQQQGNAPVCTSSGGYSQDGQFGSTPQVTDSCTDGTARGNVTAFSEMNVTPGGITMNFTAPSTNAGSKGCSLNGSMIGIRQ